MLFYIFDTHILFSRRPNSPPPCLRLSEVCRWAELVKLTQTWSPSLPKIVKGVKNSNRLGRSLITKRNKIRKSTRTCFRSADNCSMYWVKPRSFPRFLQLVKNAKFDLSHPSFEMEQHIWNLKVCQEHRWLVYLLPEFDIKLWKLGVPWKMGRQSVLNLPGCAAARTESISEAGF